MPTGYTAVLHDGEQTFPDFVMRCAHAFGALIEMRDEPLDSEVPEFQPSSYSADAVARARARLTEVMAWTDEQAQAAADESWRTASASWEASQRKSEERIARYEAMIAQVQGWQPPTDEHVELREFMIQQLNDSARYDGPMADTNAPRRLSGADFLQAEIERTKNAIAYHTTSYADEVRRTSERNEWVRALRASLQENSPS